MGVPTPPHLGNYLADKKERLSMAIENSLRKPSAVDFMFTDSVTVEVNFCHFSFLFLTDSTTMLEGLC